uniref:Secreted protein n=1 Tax=Angiostrongylus costaricensis TaxID=334426 RepID=A0A0R3PZ09_ANGCS|nr:unnamed protein product [Angiostrongylus costaricensis]
MCSWTLFIFLIVVTVVSEAAQRCYSGSKNKYESRLCDTGVAGKYVCQKFVCEGGKCEYIRNVSFSSSAFGGYYTAYIYFHRKTQHNTTVADVSAASPSSEPGRAC